MKFMVQCSGILSIFRLPPALGCEPTGLDQLGRRTRRTSLADKFQMTLTGMKKHVQVLERAGLVVSQKVGRVRICKLGQRGLEAEAEWIEAHRKLFEVRFDALDEIINELKQEESDGSAI